MKGKKKYNLKIVYGVVRLEVFFTFKQKQSMFHPIYIVHYKTWQFEMKKVTR